MTCDPALMSRRRDLAARGGALGLALALLAACQGPASTTSSAAPAAAQPQTSTRVAAAVTPLQRSLAFALGQLQRTVDEQPPGRYPFVAVGDAPWLTHDASNWMAGFFPGQLWLAYEATGDKAWAQLARARQQDLVARQHDTSTHDLGFVMFDSFGQQLRLTHDPAAKAVLLNSARSLASRWVPKARTLRSWNGPKGQVTVIVDNMVNLELLFWGARHGGPERWRHIALQHALTTRDQLVRADGSTVQAVRFDEITGKRVWRGNIGGLSRHSTWARGQAWAVYGYTMAYRETHDPRMLAVARRTAHFALHHLPADGVPFWDYDAPATRSTPRDSSAAAVLSSAFLDLARIDPDAGRRATYRAAGLHTLRTLAGPRYLSNGSLAKGSLSKGSVAQGSGARSILLHAHNNPTYPDVGVPYGDYYFLEALMRSRLLPAR
jgi:unsaturated chondroitin disaccharide hydrolase